MAGPAAWGVLTAAGLVLLDFCAGGDITRDLTLRRAVTMIGGAGLIFAMRFELSDKVFGAPKRRNSKQ